MTTWSIACSYMSHISQANLLQLMLDGSEDAFRCQVVQTLGLCASSAKPGGYQHA